MFAKQKHRVNIKHPMTEVKVLESGPGKSELEREHHLEQFSAKAEQKGPDLGQKGHGSIAKFQVKCKLNIETKQQNEKVKD